MPFALLHLPIVLVVEDGQDQLLVLIQVLLDEIGGDRGRGGVAPNHALVHLHQVLLLLHSKTAAAGKKRVHPPLLTLQQAAYTPPLPPLLLRGSFSPLCDCFRAGC